MIILPFNDVLPIILSYLLGDDFAYDHFAVDFEEFKFNYRRRLRSELPGMYGGNDYIEQRHLEKG